MLNKVLEEFLLFLERLYDPYSKWKQRNNNNGSVAKLLILCNSSVFLLHFLYYPLNLSKAKANMHVVAL